MGCFPPSWKCDLHIVDGNLDQYQYLQILKETLLPFVRLTFGHTFVYQDDNASPHIARPVINFMETEGIEHIEWLAVSPDLNPIENLWSELYALWMKVPTCLLIWRNCDRQSLMHGKLCPFQTLAILVDSIPGRVQSLYDARGGHTKY